VMEAMKAPNIFPLGAAQVAAELLPTAALNRKLAAIAREVRGAGASYGDTSGVPTLRRQLAKQSVRWGQSLHENEFIVTVGAMEALNLCLRAVAKPADVIAVESPTYFGVLQAIEALGLKAVEVPSRPREGLDLAALERVLGQGAVAVLASTTVSNPMGVVMSDDSKRDLVDLCRQFDVPLIEDDVYGDLAFEGRPRPASAFDTDGRVLLVGSVSKTLAPGYRIGWVVPGRYFERVEALKYSLTVSTPSLLQMAVAEFFSSAGYERHLRRLKAQLERQVDATRAAIARTFPPGTRVSAPRGGFVLWVELPVGVDAFELHRNALAQRVAITPGPLFSASGRFTNHIRLSCGQPFGPRVEAALATVGRLAEAQLVATPRTAKANLDSR
jgi:DNA-binding transcriptional MocR family regulator